jgi:hypothetical protein
MSRITGSDAKALMEAYAAIYAPQEITEEQTWQEVENWVNSLVEEGYDLSEYTWEDMYEAYVGEQLKGFDGKPIPVSAADKKKAENEARFQQRAAEYKAKGGSNYAAYLAGGGNKAKSLSPSAAPQDIERQGRAALNAKAAKDKITNASQEDKNKAAENIFKLKPGSLTKPEPPTEPTARPKPLVDGGNRKVLPAATKPVVKQTGDKTKDMATWAKANPTLASKVTAAGTQKGTGQSTMAKQAAELRAMRPATPSPSVKSRFPATNSLGGVNAASSTSPSASGSVAPATAKLAATPKPTPVAPNKATGSKKPGSAFEQYDAYDVVLEYLFDNGHVDTVDEAHYVMMEMDAEMIANICEGIDFKGAAREQARRDAEQEERDKEVPTNKERRLMKGRFRPGASSAERAEGGRDALKQKGKVPRKDGKDMFEQVLEHLISEGYADTEESAIEIIANMSEGWIQSIVEEFLDEEEGSYGATPKAYSAARGTKMTAKRKPFLKKMLNRTNPANRTPDDSPRKGMTSDDRERARAGSKHGVGTRQDHDYPSEGPGGVTKSAKKLRKQKAMGEFSEEAFAAWIDEAMTNYEKNRKRAAQRAAARNAARDQGKTGAVPGVGYVTPRRERETWTDESGKTRHAKGL